MVLAQLFLALAQLSHHRSTLFSTAALIGALAAFVAWEGAICGPAALQGFLMPSGFTLDAWLLPLARTLSAVSASAALLHAAKSWKAGLRMALLEALGTVAAFTTLWIESNDDCFVPHIPGSPKHAAVVMSWISAVSSTNYAT
jgi:hypothetical protein